MSTFNGFAVEVGMSSLLGNNGISESSGLKRDFKKDIYDFDQKPVAEVTGDDKHAADVLKFNGYLSLGYKDGSIIYVKTSKADRILAMM